MCKICVAEGRMTQAELDQNNAEQNDGSDGSAIRMGGWEEIFGRKIRDLFGDRDLFGRTDFALDPAMILNVVEALKVQATPDQREQIESAAHTFLDDTVSALLKMAKPYTGAGTAARQELAASAMTRELMTDQSPLAIAHALSVVTIRYVGLLDQWAALYVAEAEDEWEESHDECTSPLSFGEDT